MKKPLIGLIPLVDEKRESYWMLPGYMEGIQIQIKMMDFQLNINCLNAQII